MSALPSVSATQWRERAAALKPRSGVFIDGRFVPSASGATFDNIKETGKKNFHEYLQEIDGLYAGKAVARGERIGRIGDSDVNGGWPPHLHLQIIGDLLGMEGDFPGGEVDIIYRFTLVDGLISRLEIAP